MGEQMDATPTKTTDAAKNQNSFAIPSTVTLLILMAGGLALGFCASIYGGYSIKAPNNGMFAAMAVAAYGALSFYAGLRNRS